MATCSKCYKQIPDDTVHCGFCGAVRNKPKEKKTLFGYAALSPEALAKERELQRQTRSSSELSALGLEPMEAKPLQPAPPPLTSAEPTHKITISPTKQKTSSSLADVSTEAFDQTLLAVQPVIPGLGATHSKTPMPYQPTLAAPASLPSMGQPHVAAPINQSEPLASQGREASRGIPATLLESAQPAPPETQEAHQRQEVAVIQKIPPTINQNSTAKVEIPFKPVLASKSLAEDLAPREPGKGAMRSIMFLCGLLLLGIFFAPEGISNGVLVFSWKVLIAGEGLTIKHIFLIVGGVLFLFVALLPAPYMVRAAIGFIFALIPLGVNLGMHNNWQNYTITSSLVVLPAALFLRWKYRNSILSRVLTGLGVMAILCTAFVPIHGKLPILNTFDGIGDASATQVLTTLYPNFLLILALLSLLAMLGKGSTGLVQIWAVGLLLYLPFQSWILLLDIPQNVDNVNIYKYLPVIYEGFLRLIFLTVSALGLFQLLSPVSRPRTARN